MFCFDGLSAGLVWSTETCQVLRRSQPSASAVYFITSINVIWIELSNNVSMLFSLHCHSLKQESIHFIFIFLQSECLRCTQWVISLLTLFGRALISAEESGQLTCKAAVFPQDLQDHYQRREKIHHGKVQVISLWSGHESLSGMSSCMTAVFWL